MLAGSRHFFRFGTAYWPTVWMIVTGGLAAVMNARSGQGWGSVRTRPATGVGMGEGGVAPTVEVKNNGTH